MSQIIFITQNQERYELSAESGSLMELAKANRISGIDGDCGGVCSCATCHIHIHPDHFEQLPAASEIELEMLELEDNVSDTSRLACQVKVQDAPEGLIVTVAN
ncbi:ferredoxin [Echinicola pacifica]|uniref:Ferredoxin n=1 Tax=Echinicola pacifica TaxID=346377 RepID=A0A918UPD9_9BACT|nr:2Fe-2S iron-sulfur cluster-binding protein [Echinicola pacifica]GGZ24840.1 ferredoxin [Echinicola pacifica]